MMGLMLAPLPWDGSSILLVNPTTATLTVR